MRGLQAQLFTGTEWCQLVRALPARFRNRHSYWPAWVRISATSMMRLA